MATLICVKPFLPQPGNFAALEAVNACARRRARHGHRTIMLGGTTCQQVISVAGRIRK